MSSIWRLLKPNGNVNIKYKTVVESTAHLNRGNWSCDFSAHGYMTSLNTAKSVSAMCFWKSEMKLFKEHVFLCLTSFFRNLGVKRKLLYKPMS